MDIPDLVTASNNLASVATDYQLLTEKCDRIRVAPSDRCLQDSPVCSGQLNQ